MESRLKKLFDYQRFEGNRCLDAMLAEAETRYITVSDDELELVSAAGEINPVKPLGWKEPDDD